MHIFRGIRMMMVRLIIRATRYHELRATCFPRGGVPTYRRLFFKVVIESSTHSQHSSVQFFKENRVVCLDVLLYFYTKGERQSVQATHTVNEVIHMISVPIYCCCSQLNHPTSSYSTAQTQTHFTLFPSLVGMALSLLFSTLLFRNF